MMVICNCISIARSTGGALLLFCVVLLTPNVAHSLSESGECHYLQHDRLLESLESGANHAKGDDGVRFFVESADSSTALSYTRFSDLEIQLSAANRLYSEVLGLTPPLHMPRYQRAGFIMVILRADRTRGGQAYDEVVQSAASSACHVRMALGGQVDAAKNLTPAHELFHLYQNAHMMFKQAWLHEGLARWSESLLRGSVQEGPPLPASVEALERVLQESYGAAPFWQRLFYLLDNQVTSPIPNVLRDTFYHDGGQVVAATELYGSTFLPLLFASLDQAGAALSQQEQWPVYGWAESEQRSLRHNGAILSALHRAVSTYLPVADQPEELRVFMQLIAPMTER